jgi:hypothetical protein
MMETVNDDYLRTELDLLESMFPEEFRLDRGGQYPEFSIACDRHTKISITLHLSIPGRIYASTAAIVDLSFLFFT